MWHYIITLPWGAKTLALLVVGGGAGWAWVKHKTISGVSGAASKAAESTFFGWFGKKLYEAAPPPSTTGKPNNQKTYRGTFLSYDQSSPGSREYFFLLEDEEGCTHRVPVTSTSHLRALPRGAFVEIDTLTGVYHYAEVVQRVRLFKRK